MANALRRADPVLPDRRGRRPREVRHRLGRGQGVAGRHDQRLHRGLPRSARRQGQLGRPGLLRQPGEDRGDPASSPTTRSGSRTTCRTTRSTASRWSRASSPTPSTSSSRPATPGPITPIGINLPNDQKIREQYGSKSVSLSNINEAYDKSTPGSMRGEFSWTPEEVGPRATKYGTLGRRAAHRHARSDRPRVRPAGRAASTARRRRRSRSNSRRSKKGRADLVGLYFIADPKLAELGIMPAADQDDDRPRRVRGLHAQRARAAAARPRRARRSKKTTCATAR